MFEVQRREAQGKPKQLRKKGVLPMALVERSHGTVMLQAPVDRLRDAIAHTDSHGRIDLRIEGEAEPRKVMIKSVESDALRRQILTVTLQEVADEDQIKLDIAIVPTGHNEESDGQGVTLTQVVDHLKVRGRVADLPEQIEVDVANLHVGEHIAAGQIPLPSGIELLTPADTTVFTMSIIREPALEETPAAEAAVEADQVPAAE